MPASGMVAFDGDGAPAETADGSRQESKTKVFPHSTHHTHGTMMVTMLLMRMKWQQLRLFVHH